MRPSGIATAGAVVLGLLGLAGATAAASAAADHGEINVATPGAAFYGDYDYHPIGVRHGAFHYRGVLDDILDDDDRVKIEVRVEGYRARIHWAPLDTDAYVDAERWDPAATRTDHAWVKVCRDRGFPRDDNCNEKPYHRFAKPPE
jgi:hypothetical protein